MRSWPRACSGCPCSFGEGRPVQPLTGCVPELAQARQAALWAPLALTVPRAAVRRLWHAVHIKVLRELMLHAAPVTGQMSIIQHTAARPLPCSSSLARPRSIDLSDGRSVTRPGRNEQAPEACAQMRPLCIQITFCNVYNCTSGQGCRQGCTRAQASETRLASSPLA